MKREERNTRLLGDVIIRRGGDARHEVAGDEGSDDDGAPAGRLLLQRVTVEMQRHEDDGHLTDLTRVACNIRHTPTLRSHAVNQDVIF